MTSLSVKQNLLESPKQNKSMQDFGEIFIEALPKHIGSLKIRGRIISNDIRTNPLSAQIEEIPRIQNTMHEVLSHPITLQAQFHTENTFKAFLEKDKVDAGLLKFFNGWNETHKTTSLVSAKTIMRLSADARFVPTERS